MSTQGLHLSVYLDCKDRILFVILLHEKNINPLIADTPCSDSLPKEDGVSHRAEDFIPRHDLPNECRQHLDWRSNP